MHNSLVYPISTVLFSQLYSHSSIHLLGGLFFLIAFGFIANEVFRRSAFLAWFCFLIPPIILPYYWAKQNPDLDWLLWVKIYCVNLGTCWILLLRSKLLNKSKMVLFFTYLILVFNILIFALREAMIGGAANLLNTVAAIILVLTIPSPFRFISISREKPHDFLWDFPFGWIFGFSIWNLLALHLTFPGCEGRAFVTLIIPILVAIIIDRKLWIQSRAFTLSTLFALNFSFPKLSQALELPHFRQPLLDIVLSVLSVGWMSIYAIRLLKKHGSLRDILKSVYIQIISKKKNGT